MSTRSCRKLWATMLLGGLLLPGSGCVSEESASALAELAASTSGGVVEILVQDCLGRRLAGGDEVDLSAPISEQEE